MNDFTLLILNWYRQNKRELPWRETQNPYFIWISEIILQQTRVDQGLKYYLKFISNYPTIYHLASASEQEILNDWQGLGYYSRARNLHTTAKAIVENLEGIFPNSFNEIIKLKGIGPYTASAIASFAFGESVAVVDGNVYRVLSRYFDCDLPIDSSKGIKFFQELADTLLPLKNSDQHNQGIMEFGALQCVPLNPVCEECPLINSCGAYNSNSIAFRPVKSKKTKVSKRYFYYLLFHHNEHVVIQKRENKDIWQHLYQFPLIETETNLDESELLLTLKTRFQLEPYKISIPRKHILSHQHIFSTFLHFNAIPDEFITSSVATKDLIKYPLPRLIDRYLEELNGFF
jgi:A/G-specific adenine glycosylase